MLISIYEPNARKAIIACLAEAWSLHKTLHKNTAGDRIDFAAFLDCARDAVSDDAEWWKAYGEKYHVSN